VGVGPDSMPVRTVLHLARSRGMATGLVATAALTHATPAAFASHVPNRGMYWEIARQMADQQINVLLGGGRRYFDAAEREDGQDLLARITRDAAFVQSAAELLALDASRHRSLVGLFWEDHPGDALERAPSLSQMTRAALEVLEQEPQGFFLMVEAAQIDWRGHENAPLQDVIAEMLDFDLAIRAGLWFQRQRPNTLLVVVSDHDTGGLAIHPDTTGVLAAHYTTTGHTVDLVPLFARGPGAELFGGITRNDRVGRLLLDLVATGGARAWRPNPTSTSDEPWDPSSH
jgi:alkaline phosphatase